MDEVKTIKKALVIFTDGIAEMIEDTWGYRKIQDIVKGDIEGVFLEDLGWMYLNGSGKHLCVHNQKASLLFKKVYPSTMDTIYGNIVIFGPMADEDGNDTSVTDQMIEFSSTLGLRWV